MITKALGQDIQDPEERKKVSSRQRGQARGNVVS